MLKNQIKHKNVKSSNFWKSFVFGALKSARTLKLTLKCFFGPYNKENDDIKKIEPSVYKSANFLAEINKTGK